MFIEGIEGYTADELPRIEIAKSRMDDELALFIHTAQKSWKIKRWGDMVDYLQVEFRININFGQAWRVHDGQQHDWREKTHTFI